MAGLILKELSGKGEGEVEVENMFIFIYAAEKQILICYQQIYAHF